MSPITRVFFKWDKTTSYFQFILIGPHWPKLFWLLFSEHFLIGPCLLKCRVTRLSYSIEAEDGHTPCKVSQMSICPNMIILGSIDPAPSWQPWHIWREGSKFCWWLYLQLSLPLLSQVYNITICTKIQDFSSQYEEIWNFTLSSSHSTTFWDKTSISVQKYHHLVTSHFEFLKWIILTIMCKVRIAWPCLQIVSSYY